MRMTGVEGRFIIYVPSKMSDDDEGRRLYVGNLSYHVKEDEIYKDFEKYGEVTEVKIMTDRETGRARGFCFVTFKELEDAKDAIKHLDNEELYGRRIKVNKADPRGARGVRQSYRYGSDGGRSSGGGGGGFSRERSSDSHRYRS